jgi:hypothetical protein
MSQGNNWTRRDQPESPKWTPVTSQRQIDANRRNAVKSTGPKTDAGKERSRCNALRHGLTAETVVGGLEDPQDYRAFELSVTSDFNATTAVERELVLRLASALWRLRRTTAIESGLLQIQNNLLNDKRKIGQRPGEVDQDAYSMVASTDLQSSHGFGAAKGGDGLASPSNVRVGWCFLRLINFDNNAFEKLSRYEVSLWRQTYALLYSLAHLRGR